MGITGHWLRAAGALAIIAASSGACGMDLRIGGDDCGDVPAVDGCLPCNGVSQPLTCVDGEWSCPARNNCSEPPYDDQSDCIDACGNFSTPDNGVCVPTPGCEEPFPPDRASAQWSESVGSGGFERANGIAIDGDGNVLIVGSFIGVLHFDGGEMLSQGGYDIAIMKYSPSGALLWAVQRGGAGDDVANGIGVDGSGRVVVSGFRNDTVMHGVTSGGLFVQQLSPQGIELWSVDSDAFASDRHVGLAVDSVGNITLVGPVVAGTSITGPPMGDGAFYVASLAPDGQQRWLRTFDIDDYNHLGGVASDDQGNVFVTGMFRGTLQSDVGQLVSAGGFDAFLLGLDNNGNGTFARSFGDANDDEVGARVAADGQGGVVMTGSFTGDIDVGGSSISAPGERGAFVASFDAGGALRWAQSIHGATTTLSWHDRFSVAVGTQGDVFVGGHFEGISNVTQPNMSAGNYDAMIVRYGPDGNYRWGYAFGDDNTELVAAVAVGPGPSFAVLGEFWGGPDLGNGQLTSHAEGSMFVALYDDDAR